MRSVTSNANVSKTVGRRLLSDEISRRILKDFISNAKVKPGELLPSEGRLSSHYQVSKVTTRAAVRSLWENGVISVRNGVGAVVLPRAHEITHGLDRLASIDTFARETGHRVDTIGLVWEQVAACADASRRLRIPIGDPVLLIRRCKVIDDTPAAWIIDSAPMDLINVNEIREQFRGSVLDVLLENDRYGLEYADSEVRPLTCDDAIRGQLPGVNTDVLLYLDTTVVTKQGRPILRGQVWMDPHHFRFSFRRRRFS
jgi:DNA-binding GntR family transcriptional regulator